MTIIMRKEMKEKNMRSPTASSLRGGRPGEALSIRPAGMKANDLAGAGLSRSALRSLAREGTRSVKQEVGLDGYEIRSRHGWYGHIARSMPSLSFLSKLGVKLERQEADRGGDLPA
jgi:SRSO17 transposase